MNLINIEKFIENRIKQFLIYFGRTKRFSKTEISIWENIIYEKVFTQKSFFMFLANFIFVFHI